MIGTYTSFKKKTNISSRNHKMEQIANYHLMNNYDYKLYVDTVKKNVNTESRTELKKLKEDIESGIIDKVIVNSISDISRNYNFTVEFMKFLKEHDCELECIKEGKLCLDDYDRIIFNEPKKLEEGNVR